ncbi:MAG: DUF2784 domain-containing protein [Cyclobacteriaceae bacterium]
MYKFLDVLLTLAHLLIIGFNLTAWIWRKTRRLHLLSVMLTAFSWLLLGIWYGWGYCFLTDWHWQVKRKLGKTDLPSSFIKFAVDETLGVSSDPFWINIITAVGFGIVTIISVMLNIRDRRNEKKIS